MRRGCDEFDANASFAVDAPANVDDVAFLFGLIAHVDQEQALAARHDAFECQKAAIFIGVHGFGLFVKRLLLHVRAIDQHLHGISVAQNFPPVGNELHELFRADAEARDRPLSFCSFECFPDAAHGRLPSDWPASACAPTIAIWLPYEGKRFEQVSL